MKKIKYLLLALVIVLSTLALVGCFGGSSDSGSGNENGGGQTFVVQYGIQDGQLGSFHETVMIAPGDTFTSINAPRIPGYMFLGWFEYTDDGERKQWNEGDALPQNDNLAVWAEYEVIEYSINIYAGTELCATDIYRGVTYFAMDKYMDPSIDYDHHESYDQCYFIYLGGTQWSESVAQFWFERDGIEYNWQYILCMNAYTNEEMTEPLTELEITEDTNIYIDYAYVPIRYESNDDGTAKIVGLDYGEEHIPNGILRIPENIIDLTVVEIAPGAFAREDIKEVILPSTVTKIGECAFEGSQIESVVIPASVTEFGDSAFKDCESLRNVDIKATIEFDIDNVFENCTSIEYEVYGNVNYLGYYMISLVSSDVTSAQIKEGTKKIPAGFFENSLIESVTIPSSVTYIGENAFANTRLVQVIIPDSVEFLGSGAFKNSALESATVGNGITSIEENTFANTKLAQIIIPTSVVSIGDNAFEGTCLVEIVIPQTVANLGKSLFKNCTLLEEFTINTTASFEFMNLFEGCINIKGEEYGNAYYYGNEFIRPVSKDITWAKIKPECERVPDNAFKDCTRLNRVYLPKTVKRVGAYAFYNVNAPYFALYMESYTSTSIIWEGYANAGYNQVTGEDFTYKWSDFPQNVLMDEENSVAYAIENMKEYTGLSSNGVVIYGHFGSEEEIVIPEQYNNISVQVIYPNAFMGDNTLKEITISKCYVVGSAAFWEATSLEEVILPEAIGQIGTRAFYGCSSLRSISLGDPQILGKQAFEGCVALETATASGPLKAWSPDLSESVEYEQGTNLAQLLIDEKLYWWFLDSAITKEQAEQILAAAL